MRLNEAQLSCLQLCSGRGSPASLTSQTLSVPQHRSLSVCGGTETERVWLARLPNCSVYLYQLSYSLISCVLRNFLTCNSSFKSFVLPTVSCKDVYTHSCTCRAMQQIFHQYSILWRFTQATCLQFFILSIGWKDTPGPLGFTAFRGPKYAVYYEAVVTQVQEEEQDNHAGEGDLAESHCTPFACMLQFNENISTLLVCSIARHAWYVWCYQLKVHGRLVSLPMLVKLNYRQCGSYRACYSAMVCAYVPMALSFPCLGCAEVLEDLGGEEILSAKWAGTASTYGTSQTHILCSVCPQVQ